MNTQTEKDIFISYRREGGELMAHIIYERLDKEGYSVFQDIESLRSGKFNTALYDVIESCSDFILILPPGGLNRCESEDDWVRKEIEYALSLKKNIIPIMLRGFEWPEKLPDSINELRYFNGLAANTEYFEQFLVRLQGFLHSANRKVDPAKGRKKIVRVVLVLGVYLIFLISPLIKIFVFRQPLLLWERLLYFLIILFGAYWFWNAIETRPNFAASCFGSLTEEDLQGRPDQVYSRVVGVFGKKILISREVPEGYQSYYTLKRLEFGSWDNKKVNYLKIQFRRSLEWYDPSALYLHSMSRGEQAVKMLTRQGFQLQATPVFLPAEVDYLTKDNLHVFLWYDRKRLSQMEYYHCTAEELMEHIIV